MTLVVAPAGAGKTLGVAGWLCTTDEPDESLRPRWEHADETWDAARLVEVLDAAAARRAGPAEGDQRPQRVVIDDAHLLPAACHRVLSDRLNDDPEGMRLVLLSRWDLPVAHLVPELLGHFAVIRGDVLSLDDDEAQALIVPHAQTDSPEVVSAVTRYARGWCAAVVLASRAVGSSPDPVAAASRCAEGESRLGDRVAGEVFASLSPRVRHLLLSLSAESFVTARTAAHLSHDPTAGDMLAELDGTGLLVSRTLTDTPPAVDGDDDDDDHAGRARYRLHPLLQEVVRRRLVNDGVDVAGARATVVRAVLLDAANGVTARGLERLVNVLAFEEAADFLAAHGLSMVMRGEGAGLATFVRDHPAHVERNSAIWFPLAIERWVAGDAPAAERWLERCVTHGADLREEEVACLRLMRARLGREPLLPAIGFAREVVLAEKAREVGAEILPQLLTELAITQNWLGELHEAEVNLVAAVALSRTRALPALRAAALSHLAMNQFMLGRERACTEVAHQALVELGEARAWAPRFTGTRLRLASSLARALDIPWEPVQSFPDAPLHPADLCSAFWLRIQNAHAALVGGSVAEGRRLLEQPLDLPEACNLPDHLRVVWLVEHATMAAFAGDRDALRTIANELAASSFRGEAAWAEGLHADLGGDRRQAAAHFETAIDDATFAQPVVRGISLVARAQLLDELGESDEAYELLNQAVIETEVRRNAAPFLGWIRQGTPVQTMLAHLAQRSGRVWAAELAATMQETASLPTYFDPGTATPGEAVDEGSVHVPVLSAREREVLRQLARGATYADISAALFVSENTVKTHISNLYAKLGAARRSEALALARGHRLI